MEEYGFEDLEPGAFNESRQAHERFVRFRGVFLPCVYLVVFACGLLGNSLVLVIYVFYQKLRSMTDVFLANLPLADLVFVCTLPFWAYAGTHGWVFGRVPCKALRGTYAVNFYTSMLTLTCITADRFAAVVRATQAYGQGGRPAWGKAVCALVWAASLLVSLPQAIYADVLQLDRPVCDLQDDRVSTVVLAAQMALGFFLPLLTMAVCYSVIIRTLLRARGFRKHRSLKIILLVLALFLLTQTPFNLVQLIRSTSWEYHAMTSVHYAVVVTEAIAYLRACLNPVLYAFVGLKFRRNFWRLVEDAGCLPFLGAARRWKSPEDSSKTCSASHNAEATGMSQL